MRLIELNKGMPVVALFYLTCLDLIYVKTVEDVIGYVPRDCCRPICKSLSLNQDSLSRAVDSLKAPQIISQPPQLPPPPPPLPLPRHELLSSSLGEAFVGREFIPIRSCHLASVGHRMSDIGKSHMHDFIQHFIFNT